MMEHLLSAVECRKLVNWQVKLLQSPAGWCSGKNHSCCSSCRHEVCDVLLHEHHTIKQVRASVPIQNKQIQSSVLTSVHQNRWAICMPLSEMDTAQ